MKKTTNFIPPAVSIPLEKTEHSTGQNQVNCVNTVHFWIDIFLSFFAAAFRQRRLRQTPSKLL
ncbi:MAG: hypothetical protein D3923_05255 [Candidatus Electrothrix sp. AR3]|nr:hypothetical protein [Candidatus Electrothrix sp. AR3]